MKKASVFEFDRKVQYMSIFVFFYIFVQWCSLIICKQMWMKPTTQPGGYKLTLLSSLIN
jgi:hypothetical protein